jgi:ribonuclease P protein component
MCAPEGGVPLKRTVSLKKNHEFRRLYAKGKSAAAPSCVVYCRRNGRGKNRLGLTVSTKLGCAVRRNRIRRRLRETYRLNEDKLRQGFDIVVVARARAYGAPFPELGRDFLRLCGKLELL